jgi:hypothetical protein
VRIATNRVTGQVLSKFGGDYSVVEWTYSGNLWRANMKGFLTSVLTLVSFVLSAEARAQKLPVQITLTAPPAVNIPGGDGSTSGVASNVVLILTRDVTTSNVETTYWQLKYHYYNGAYRWEDYQEMYVDFVDKFGVTLMNHAVVVGTPSGQCHYNGGIDVTTSGTMGFDFRGKDLTIKVSGSTPVPGQPNRDHKC